MLLTPNLQATGLATTDSSGDMSAFQQDAGESDGGGFAKILGMPAAASAEKDGSELPPAGIQLPPAAEVENPDAIVTSLNRQLDALLASDTGPTGNDDDAAVRLPLADLPIVEATPLNTRPATTLPAGPDGDMPVKQNTVTAVLPAGTRLRQEGQSLPVEPPAAQTNRTLNPQRHPDIGTRHELPAGGLPGTLADDVLPGARDEARNVAISGDRNPKPAPDPVLPAATDSRGVAVKADAGMVMASAADPQFGRQELAALAQNAGGTTPGPLQGGEVGTLPAAQVSRSTESALTAARPPAAMTIDLPVQETGWDKAVSERVVMLANGRLQNAEIRLTPAELGPLRVTVNVEDGSAHVNFQAAHALTRDAIEQALPRLRELLDASGLSLGDAQVSDQDVQEGREDRSNGETALPGELVEDEDVSVAEPRARRGERGLVDTFV